MSDVSFFDRTFPCPEIPLGTQSQVACVTPSLLPLRSCLESGTDDQSDQTYAPAKSTRSKQDSTTSRQRPPRATRSTGPPDSAPTRDKGKAPKRPRIDSDQDFQGDSGEDDDEELDEDEEEDNAPTRQQGARTIAVRAAVAKIPKV